MVRERREEILPGLASRAAASFVVIIGWMIFILLFWVFYSMNFNLLQNIVIIIVSLLVVVALLGSMWVYRGIKLGIYFEKEWKHWKHEYIHKKKAPPGLAPKVIATIAVGAGWSIFALLFLGFYSSGFDVMQKIAIVLIPLIAAGAILGSIWAYWGIKVGKRYEKERKRGFKRKRSKR